MEAEEAELLLRKNLPNDQSDEKDSSTLINALEYIPLAITQVVTYIAVNAPRMTISKYLDLFCYNEFNQMSLLIKDGGDLRRDPEVPNSVMMTWQISFDQIKEKNLLAANLLFCI